MLPTVTAFPTLTAVKQSGPVVEYAPREHHLAVCHGKACASCPRHNFPHHLPEQVSQQGKWEGRAKGGNGAERNQGWADWAQEGGWDQLHWHHWYSISLPRPDSVAWVQRTCTSYLASTDPSRPPLVQQRLTPPPQVNMIVQDTSAIAPPPP